ncbi:hypothetical protein LTR95_009890 [Oleoguttula sp. CCFEE 5521]
MEQFMAENPDIQANSFAGMNDPLSNANLAGPADHAQPLPAAANTQPITPMTATGLPLPADNSYHPDIKWFRSLDHYRPEQLPAQAHYQPDFGHFIPCSPPPLTPMEGVQGATPLGGIFGAFPAPPTMMPAPYGRPNKKRKVSLSDIKDATCSKCQCPSTKEARKGVVPRVENPWILFRTAYAAKAIEGMAQTAVSGNPSAAWKAMDAIEKAKWQRKYEEKKAQHEIGNPGYHFLPGANARLDFGNAQCRCGTFALNSEQLRVKHGIFIAAAAPAAAPGGGMGSTAGTPVPSYGGTHYGGIQYGATQYGVLQYGVSQYGANPYTSTQHGTIQANTEQQPHPGDVRMGNTPEFDDSELQTTPAEADRVMRNLFPDVPLSSTESFSPYVGRPLNHGPPSVNTRAKSLSPFDPALLDPRLFLDPESLASISQEGAGDDADGPATRTRLKSLSPEKDAEEDLYGLSPRAKRGDSKPPTEVTQELHQDSRSYLFDLSVLVQAKSEEFQALFHVVKEAVTE